MCISKSVNASCFQKFKISTREWDVRNLNPSTKYYVRVLASTKVGDGPYSETKGFLTNASKRNNICMFRFDLCLTLVVDYVREFESNIL